eukprot:3094123-Pyramimonas_sp.AAC.1
MVPKSSRGLGRYQNALPHWSRSALATVSGPSRFAGTTHAVWTQMALGHALHRATVPFRVVLQETGPTNEVQAPHSH